MNRTISTFVLTAAIAAAAYPAMAQTTDATATGTTSPLAVRIGGYFPTDSAGRNDGGSTLFAAGADYSFIKSGEAANNSPGIYFDYLNGSKNGGNVNIYGAGIQLRSSAPALHKGTITPYFGIAGGYYRLRVKDSTTKLSSTDQGFGGKVFAGIGIGGPLFVEANYQYFPSVDGVNISGFGAQVGLRF